MSCFHFLGPLKKYYGDNNPENLAAVLSLLENNLLVFLCRSFSV